MQITYDPTNHRQNNFADCVAQSLGKCTDEFQKQIDDKLKESLDKMKEQLDELEKRTKLLVPPGIIQAFGYPDAPKEGWLPCNGEAVSRDKYADLFKAIGTNFGEGDGSTTFNVPDLQGQFLRGYPGGYLDPDREFASVQGDAIRDIQGAFGKNVTAKSSIFETRSASGAFEAEAEIDMAKALATIPSLPSTAGIKYPLGYKFKASNMVPTADENRPVNISLLFCIKT